LPSIRYSSTNRWRFGLRLAIPLPHPLVSSAQHGTGRG
jgi:hypothetical protein